MLASSNNRLTRDGYAIAIRRGQRLTGNDLHTFNQREKHEVINFFARSSPNSEQTNSSQGTVPRVFAAS